MLHTIEPVPLPPRPMDMSRPPEPKPVWLTTGLSNAAGLDRCFANLRRWNDLKRSAEVEKVGAAPGWLAGPAARGLTHRRAGSCLRCGLVRAAQHFCAALPCASASVRR